jgi:hypothetical protein
MAVFDPKKDYSVAIAAAKAKGQDTSALETARAYKIAASSDTQLASWNINRAGQSLSTPQPPSGPAQLSQTEINTLKLQPNVKNDITIYNSNGSVSTHVDGYVLNGHSYNDQGQRLFSYGDGGGVYDVTSKQYKTDIHGDDYAYTSSATLREQAAPVYYYEPVYYSPPPPPFISWNENPPTFSSDLKKVNKYSYFFGVDKLTIAHAEINQNCCFISKEISLGDITNCYLQLEADCDISSDSSIEFYIIDGGIEHPIVPVKDILVSNEKIFCGLNTRFPIDSTKDISIKKDGNLIDVTIAKAIQSSDGLYTVTYTPVNSYNYKPINSVVKIKIILRLYNKSYDAPYISKMKIRKFGGGTLWQDISVV